ncbi:MAG TPA: hypothetical protein VGN06_00980 [Gaiellaceae bacterium]
MSVWADPYTRNDFEDFRRDFMVRGYIGLAAKSPRAMCLTSPLTNDVGAETHAAAVERLIRAFHRRPSLLTFRRLLRAAFLSGIEDSRRRVY